MRTCVRVLSDHPKCEDGHFQQVVAYESQTTGGRGEGGGGGGGKWGLPRRRPNTSSSWKRIYCMQYDDE